MINIIYPSYHLLSDKLYQTHVLFVITSKLHLIA